MKGLEERERREETHKRRWRKGRGSNGVLMRKDEKASRGMEEGRKEREGEARRGKEGKG